MTFQDVHIHYSLSLTKGKVDNDNEISFVTMPILNVTSLIYWAGEVARKTQGLRYRLSVGWKLLTISSSSLAFGLGV